ncbi:MAG: T9SS type A sorting domain-containing protein [Flavobacteriales bacterium]|nr:T9SS type A sorting domain-containing protein [Flavobacteriales bacterium]
MIKKLLFITTLFSLVCINVTGQNNYLEWVDGMGNNGSDIGRSIVEWGGDIYITGSFEDTVDFDPGPGIFNLISNGGKDIFLQKLDANGDLLWAKSIGGVSDDEGMCIALNANGWIGVTGYFQDTVNFAPPTGSNYLSSVGGKDIFVLSIAANGDFRWTKSIGGTADDVGTSITVDVWVDYYVTGYFSGTVDFNPDTGITNLVSTAGYDAFVLKLSDNNWGSFIWAHPIGGSGYSWGTSIVADQWALNQLYVIGVYDGSINIDMFTGGTLTLGTLGGLDIFVAHMDIQLGDFMWVKVFGGFLNDWGTSISVRNSGTWPELYITGSFQGTTMDFQTGGTTNLVSAGGEDAFVQKLNGLSGNIIWEKSMGGPLDDKAYSISSNWTSNISLTGSFKDTADFDPSSGIANLISNGEEDIFVQELDPNGNFVWAKSMGGIGSDIGYSISNNAFVTGSFENTVDFDPDTGITILVSSGLEDIYVLKLGVPVGVEEFEDRLFLPVYPNPANSIITIEIPAYRGKLEAIFHLIDVTGKQVLSKSIQSNTTQLDVGWLPKGLYFYRFLDKRNQLNYTGKLVVQ